MAAPTTPTILPGQSLGAQNLNLVLGLQWKRVVTREDDEVAAAKALARKAGSNHVLMGRGLSGTSIRIVGHGKLPKTDVPCYSAAYALQIEHGESEIVVAGITLDDGQSVWVCAVSEGLICHGFDVVLPVDLAQEKVSDFVQGRTDSAEKIIFYGDLFKSGREKTFKDLADYASGHHPDKCRIEKLEAKSSIPKPVLLGGVFLVLALGGKYAWDEYEEADRRKKLAEMASAQAPELAPAEVWKRSLKVWTDSKKISGFKSIEDGLKGVGSLATNVAGWTLNSVRCARKAAVWDCEASYLREDGSPATSKAFVAALQGQKNIQWIDLNSAKVNFSVPTSEDKIAVEKLPEDQGLLINLASALQHSQPAFHSVGRLPAFAAVPVPLIKKEDGTAYVIDQAAVRPRPLVASVDLAGPVRSVFALKDFNIDWREFTIGLKAIGKPSVKESAINFTVLKGDVYAVQK